MPLMRRQESFPLLRLACYYAVCEVQATMASKRRETIERLHIDQKHMGVRALGVTAWKLHAEGRRPTDEVDRLIVPLPFRLIEEHAHWASRRERNWTPL